MKRTFNQIHHNNQDYSSNFQSRYPPPFIQPFNNHIPAPIPQQFPPPNYQERNNSYQNPMNYRPNYSNHSTNPENFKPRFHQNNNSLNYDSNNMNPQYHHTNNNHYNVDNNNIRPGYKPRPNNQRGKGRGSYKNNNSNGYNNRNPYNTNIMDNRINDPWLGVHHVSATLNSRGLI